MPRAMWSGSISFGMVNIPVKLYSAVSPKDIHFHQVHDADGVRIQQKRICPADGKEVPYEHIVKGYEISPNKYVLIRPEELAALDSKATNTIEIESFVDLGEIDPLYFENSYYLAPDKGAAKAYALLLTAMAESKKVAVAKTVMRTKQYLTILRPSGRALSMSTLYYADEVVSQDTLEELPRADAKLDARELAMAKQLIGSLASPFDLAKYHDDYRARVIQMIEKKAEGQEISVQPDLPQPSKVVNLMEALEASLAAARKGRAAPEQHAVIPAKKAERHAPKKRKTA